MSEQAERYKAQGNAALQARNFDDAVELYFNGQVSRGLRTYG